MEPCKPGKRTREYKWCRCMQSCGPIEDKYRPYEMGNINGLHLIAEIYDDDTNPRRCRLYRRFRNTWLTEDYWAYRRDWILYPQLPYGKSSRHSTKPYWITDEDKFNYDNYLEGTEPEYWGWPEGN